MYELDWADLEITQRTRGQLKRRLVDEFTDEEVARGLNLLVKRGHAETDPRWRLAHLPSKAFRLTPEGRDRLAEITARRAAYDLEQFRSSPNT